MKYNFKEVITSIDKGDAYSNNEIIIVMDTKGKLIIKGKNNEEKVSVSDKTEKSFIKLETLTLRSVIQGLAKNESDERYIFVFDGSIIYSSSVKVALLHISVFNKFIETDKVLVDGKWYLEKEFRNK